MAKKMMNNVQRVNQAQRSNPMMGGLPFIQNNFNIMPPMQPLNAFFGFMPNQAPLAFPGMMPYIPMQQPPPMIPQGSNIFNGQTPLNMSRPSMINSASMAIPVNPAVLNLGPQISMNGFNNNNQHHVNNSSQYPQRGNFQHFYGGNRPY